MLSHSQDFIDSDWEGIAIPHADDFQRLRRLTRSLPEVEEGTAYGTPAFRVGKKLLARLHEDRVTLVLRIDLESRDFLMQAHPEVYFITDHYRNYPYVLVRLDAIGTDELKGRLELAWRSCAAKRVLAMYDQRKETEQ
ncbi:MmcQ/YjbR family DNA-binding protein [Cohnella hongkongensis]|uniref:MmcQ/YjbR family DNA-binding protein n=1 Tax=Cohnella hongkongensis TaxID=178337 RepID=A0ABV9F646_9BACL